MNETATLMPNGDKRQCSQCWQDIEPGTPILRDGRAQAHAKCPPGAAYMSPEHLRAGRDLGSTATDGVPDLTRPRAPKTALELAADAYCGTGEHPMHGIELATYKAPPRKPSVLNAVADIYCNPSSDD